jgi:hypothetical protein
MVVEFLGCDVSYMRSCILAENFATVTNKPRKLPLHCPTTLHVSCEMIEQGFLARFVQWTPLRV